MQVYVNKYTGNGTTLAVTGVGFQPDVVIIKGLGISGANTNAAFTMTEMLPFTKALDGQWADSASITSLDVDGFTVDNTADRTNRSDVVYEFICIKGAVSDLFMDSYVGDGGDDKSITGAGFQPDVVIIPLSTSLQTFPAYRQSFDSTDITHYFRTTASAANIIQALEADGFQAGVGANLNSETYYWLALKAVAGTFAQGNYTGNGVDDRSITGLGFQPDFVIIKNITTSTTSAVLTSSQATVGEAQYPGTTADGTNIIQALQADGFQVGTEVQSNTDGETYLYMAWKTTQEPVAVADGSMFAVFE